MSTSKFSADVMSLDDSEVNLVRDVKQVEETHRPILLTSHGRCVAVVQSVNDYDAVDEEREFMKAVLGGLADIEASREAPLAEVRARLGLK